MSTGARKPSSVRKQAGQSSSASDKTKLATLLAETVAERDILKRVIDAMPDTGLTIRDRDYRLTFQSELTVRLYGNRLGEKCYSVFSGRNDVCEGCPVALAFEDGQPHTSVRQVVMPSGDVTFWENVASPIRDADGKITSCLEINTNITQHKEAEEALLRSEAKYKSLVQNIPSVTWTTDCEGKTVFISPNVKDVYGFTSEEICSDGEDLWLKRIHPEDVERVKKGFAELFEKGVKFDLEYRIKRKDGAWIWLHDRAVTTYVEDNVLCADGVFTDVTERKRLEQSLANVTEEERERLRRDLHDSIGQQLTGLRFLMASLHRKLLATQPETADLAAQIEQITGDTLTSVWQVAKGLEPLPEGPHALVTALEQLASRVSNLHGIQCSFTSREPVLIQNPETATHLFLIAQEAVSNAVKHAKPSRMTISLSERNGTLRLAVRDDGVGFSRKKKSEGMGLNIMRSRARIIDAALTVRAGKSGGTVVTCSWKKTPEG